MKQKIKELHDSLVVKTRDSGKEFVCQVDGLSEELQNAIRDIHGVEMLPDDFRYETIYGILGVLLNESMETEDDLREAMDGIVDSQTDIYNYSLVEWLGSNTLRASYCDETHAQGFEGGDIIRTIQLGQCLEIEEIYNNIVNYLI